MSDKILEGIDWELYRTYNHDLSHMNQAQLIEHYTKYGRYEKRKFAHDLPEDFDVSIYREKHDDLRDFSDEELKRHYTLHGKDEQRAYRLNDKRNRKISRKTVKDLKSVGITYVIL